MASKLDLLMKQTQKNHGDGSFGFASGTRDSGARRIPTGIFLVDYATGGGIPVGRMTSFYGKRSAGKTSIVAKTVASAQRLCRSCYGEVIFEDQEVKIPTVERGADGKIVETTKTVVKAVPVDCVNECRVLPESDADLTKAQREKKLKAGKGTYPGRLNVVWVDAEGAFDPRFFSQFGVDCDPPYGVRVLLPDYGEQSVDIADAAIRTGECDVLVVDSLAQLVPNKEREDSAEAVQVATQARLINKGLKLWAASLNEVQAQGGTNDCTVLLINQLRSAIGPFPVDVLPGGRAQEFVTSLDLKLWQAKDGGNFDTMGSRLWQETRFAVEKNKCGGAKSEGFYKMCVKAHPGRTPGDTWDDEVVFDFAKREGYFEILEDKEGVPTGRLKVLDREFDNEEAIKEGRPSDGKLAANKKTRGTVKV
jgi:RecA/RadA recombinase